MAALDFRMANLTGAGEPVQVSIVRASGTLFDVLETPVALGRALTPRRRAARPAGRRRDQPAPVARTPRRRPERGRPQPDARRHSVHDCRHPSPRIRAAGVRSAQRRGIADRAGRRDRAAAPQFPEHRLDGAVQLPRRRALAAWRDPRPGPRRARRPAAGGGPTRRERETHEAVALGGTITLLDESIVGRARLGLLLLLGAIGGRRADRMLEPRQPVAHTHDRHACATPPSGRHSAPAANGSSARSSSSSCCWPRPAARSGCWSRGRRSTCSSGPRRSTCRARAT